MVEAPMVCALGCGSSSCNISPMRAALPLQFATCQRPPVNGTKLVLERSEGIEHRLFSYISINWRGKPLLSLETIIELISHTTTKEGLTVTAVKDTNTYPTGIKVTDEELAGLNILRDSFHGEWNYTIRPQNSPSEV